MFDVIREIYTRKGIKRERESGSHVVNPTAKSKILGQLPSRVIL